MNLKDKTIVIDGKTYHYSKIVMLECDKSFFYLHCSKLYNNRTTMHIPDGKQLPQHLYFLSIDKICEGDWFYDSESNTINKSHGILNGLILINDNSPLGYNLSFCFKVISSTNLSLNLPKPSDSFLQVYIDAYNKNEKIEECLVEYIDWTDKPAKIYSTMGEGEWGKHNVGKLKINSKNNTIIIKKVKDSWTREEVIELINKISEEVDFESATQETIDNWIEENL